jgi:hypothetical protein
MTLNEGIGLILDGLTTLALVLVPIVVLFVGVRVTKAVKDRESGVSLLELAIEILSEVPDVERYDEEQKALRTWATEVFNAHSEIKLRESTQQALVERMPLVEPETGVRLRVADESGCPVSGAQVQLVEFPEGFRRARASGWTDGNGEVEFGHLRGSWVVPLMVSVKAIGFRDFLSETAPLTRHQGRVIVLQAASQS